MGLFSSPKRELEKYFLRHPDVKTIVIAGSFGRTSAVRALGAILGQVYTVTMGVNRSVAAPDIVLLDFGSLTYFPNIIPDFTVITSVTETGEQPSAAPGYFDLANRSRRVLINREDIPPEHSQYLTNPNIITYGDELPANFYYEELEVDLHGYTGNFVNPSGQRIHAHVGLLGEHNLRPVIMAVAIAHTFAIPPEKIIAGVATLRPVPGNLSPGRGGNGSIIIDDSSSTSTLSIKLALRAIYEIEAPSRILVTGPLDPSITIDPSLISEVLILDPSGAPPANSTFRSFTTQLNLLEYLATRLEPGAIVLLKTPLPDITTSKIL